MIVEFVGSTGAGKTTLITAVHRKLAGTAEVATAFELVAMPLGLDRTTHPTAQNLIQEVAGLPFFARSLLRYRAFLLFIVKMLARHGKITWFTLHYLRSLERTLGVYEFIRHYGQERIVLVDEGTLIPAHNVFVYTAAHYTAAEIAQFARLAPLPDVVVYIKAPVESLIRRTLQRADPPRELRSRNPVLVETYLKRATALFEQLVSTENLRNRVLVVENPEASEQARNITAEQIAEFIRHRAVAAH